MAHFLVGVLTSERAIVLAFTHTSSSSSGKLAPPTSYRFRWTQCISRCFEGNVGGKPDTTLVLAG